MIIEPDTRAAARQSFIDRICSGSSAGRVRIFAAGGVLLVDIPLSARAGVVTLTGIALDTTDYAQITNTGDPVEAAIENSNGVVVARVTAGEASTSPELPLPAAKLFAGAFIRLVGSVLDVY